jgi:hypothetical protein
MPHRPIADLSEYSFSLFRCFMDLCVKVSQQKTFNLPVHLSRNLIFSSIPHILAAHINCIIRICTKKSFDRSTYAQCISTDTRHNSTDQLKCVVSVGMRWVYDDLRQPPTSRSQFNKHGLNQFPDAS